MVEMERKHKILIAAGAVILLLLISIPAIMISGVVLWQLGVFKAGSTGMGSSGFGAVKPIDHTSSGAGNIEIVFMSAVGSTITVDSVSIYGSEASLSGNTIPAGDTFTASFNGLADVCSSRDVYDLDVNVAYTNLITGMKYTDTGRIWGSC